MLRPPAMPDCMATHAQKSNIGRFIIRGVFIQMMKVPPFDDFPFDVPLFCLPGTPGGDGQRVVGLSIKHGFLNVETSLQRPTRRTVIRPVGTPSPVRIVLVEGREVLLNPAAKVVVFKPARINNGEPKPASMARVIVVDGKDFFVHPLLGVFRVPNSLEGY